MLWLSMLTVFSTSLNYTNIAGCFRYLACEPLVALCAIRFFAGVLCLLGLDESMLVPSGMLHQLESCRLRGCASDGISQYRSLACCFVWGPYVYGCNNVLTPTIKCISSGGLGEVPYKMLRPSSHC